MGDQSKPDTVRNWVQQTGGHFDVVIDDASHANEAIRTSFNVLWPHVQPGGIYILEDLVWNRNPRAQGKLSTSAKPFVDSIKAAYRPTEELFLSVSPCIVGTRRL